MKRPTYKRIILDETQLNQLDSYLTIALNNLADHAVNDGLRFCREVNQQIEKQKFQHKKKLEGKK